MYGDRKLSQEEINRLEKKYLSPERITELERKYMPVDSRLRTPEVGRARGLIGMAARGGPGVLSQAVAGFGDAVAKGMIPLGGIPPLVPHVVTPLAEKVSKFTPQYWAGRVIRAGGLEAQKAIEKAFPTHIPQKGQFLGTWPETLVGGGATAATLLGIGMLTAGTGIPAALATIPIGAFAQSESMYQDAIASSGDEGKAQLARLIGLPIGAIEGLGELGVLGRMDVVSGGVFSRKAASVVPKFMAKYITRTAGSKTVSIAAGGLEEMLEELLQGSLENLTAQKLYDTSRSVTDNLAEQGGSGLIIGLIANALGLKIGRMLRQPDISINDQRLLQEAQTNVEDSKIKVAEDLAQAFPETTPEYWQRLMTQPEAVEISDEDALRLARTKVVDDIRTDRHTWITDKSEVQQKVKGQIELMFQPTKARGEQFVQLQEYNTKVTEKTTEYQGQVDTGIYEPTTKTARSDFEKLKAAVPDVELPQKAPGVTNPEAYREMIDKEVAQVEGIDTLSISFPGESAGYVRPDEIMVEWVQVADLERVNPRASLWLARRIRRAAGDAGVEYIAFQPATTFTEDFPKRLGAIRDVDRPGVWRMPAERLGKISQLTSSQRTKFMASIQADIAKRVAKEIPKPKPPKGLNKIEQKQVAKELREAVKTTLATMGRVEDGSIRAKKGRTQDERRYWVKGNLITFEAKDAEGKATHSYLKLTDDQMDDAVTIFTGIKDMPEEVGRRDKLISRVKTAFALTHGLKLGDMDAVADVAEQVEANFDDTNFRQGLGAMLAAGGVEGNQRLVKLAAIIDSANDLNKISKTLGKVVKTPKPGQPPGKDIGILDKNLISQLTVLRKKAGQPGVSFINLLGEDIQEEALFDHQYKVRFRNGVYNILRQFHEKQRGNLNQRIRNSMTRIERYLDNMQDKGRSNVTLNQDETVAANNLRALYNDIWDASLAAGVITKEEHQSLYVEYYLPKQWDFSAIAMANKTHEIITEIMQKKGMSDTAAKNLWNRFMRSKRDRTNYNLEHEREVKDLDSGIRGLEERTYRYIEEAARRITQVAYFGKRDVKLEALINRMEANNESHASFARKIKTNALALDVKDADDKVEAKQIAHLRSAIALTSLSWTWVQNLTEPALLTFRFSLRDTIKASKKFVVDAKLSTELAEDAAAIPITNATSTIGKIFSKSTEDYITQQMKFEEGKFGQVREFGFRLYGFTPTERFGKILAANTAVEYSDRQLRRLVKNPNNNWAKTRLVELVNTVGGTEADALIQAAGKDKNVTLEKLANSQNAQIAQLAQDAISRAGIRGIDDVGIGPTGMLRRPLSWSRGPWGRLFTQFRSWSFQVTRMMKEELRRGGARAWLKLAGVFYPVSVVVSLAERLAGRLLFGKDLPEDDAEWMWASIEAPFALGIGSIYYRALRTTITRPWAWLELFAPPVTRPVRPLLALGLDITRIATGKGGFRQQTAEEFINLVPILGRPVSGYMRKARRKKKKGKVTF